MKKDFNEFKWHDAILKSLVIDRSNPGEKDTVKIALEWPDSDLLSVFEFIDCYAFNADMNFGVIVCETILEARCIFSSKEIDVLKQKWLKLRVNLDDLKCYRIVTNSTNSVLEIYSKGYRILSV